MSTKVADLFASLGLRLDQRQWSIADRMLNGLKDRLASFSTWAQGLDMLKSVFTDVADTGDELDEMSQKTGVAVEDLQEFGYAAGQAGVGIGEVGALLNKLNINIDKAAKGGKGGAVFRQIGVAVKGANGQLRPALDVLGDVADHFQSMEDGPKKAALANQIFGKSGRALIPVLNQGREKLALLAQEYRDSGAEISGPQAEALGKFNDQYDLLKLQWTGLKRQLAIQLLPAISNLVKAMLDWFKANREIIKQRLQQFGKILIFIIKTLTKAFMAMGEAVTALITGDFSKLSSTMKLLTIIAAILGATLVAAAIASALAWLASLWPFALLAIAIAAIILIVEDLYNYFTGGQSVFGEFLDAITEYIGIDAVGVVDEAVNIIITLFYSWWDTMKLIFSFLEVQFQIVKTGAELLWKIVKPIIDGIRQAVGYVDDITNSALNPLGGNYLGLGTNLVQKKLTTAGSKDTDRLFTANTSGAPSRGSTVKVAAPHMEMHLTINGGTGSPHEMSQTFRDQADSFWEEKMREVYHGTAGGQEE